MQSQSLKAIASGFYDLQKTRIQTGNRIVANYRARLGVKPGTKPDAEEQDILDKVKQSYKLLAEAAADGTLPKPRSFKGDHVISDYAEFVLADIYVGLLENEQRYTKAIKAIIHKEPLWTRYLKEVKGVGEQMALIMLATIDISKACYPSSLWRFAGLDVAPDGRGRSRRKEHMEQIEYVDKNGETQIRNGLRHNPFLKTKLIGVLGPGFLRARGPYSKVYYDCKHRLESHPVYKDGKPGHRHNMAIRYMVKMFLIELYTEWRKLENLPVSKPYHEAKLGLRHRKSA